jgi:methionyl-tRNA formyltransferase
MIHLRFGFVTCVQLGLSCMEEIVRLGRHLELLITLKDDQAQTKSGRVRLDDFAHEHGGRLLKVGSINEHAVVDTIREYSIDWLFVIGWSQIVKPSVLGAPSRGALGMHPTLLPTGRGRAPIPWAILLGLPETGVTFFKLDQGVDSGDIIGQHRLPLSSRESATSLYGRAEEAHRLLIQEHLPALETDSVVFTPQDHRLATVWPGRKPEDGRLTQAMTVAQADRLIRATTRPYPGAFLGLPDGRKLRVWHGTPGRVEPRPAVLLRFSDGVYSATDWSYDGPVSSLARSSQR